MNKIPSPRNDAPASEDDIHPPTPRTGAAPPAADDAPAPAAGRSTSRFSRFFRRVVTLTSRRRLRNSEPWLIFLCAPLGAVVGLVVVLLHEGVSWLHVLGFGGKLDAFLGGEDVIVPWRLMVVPPVGGLLLGLLTMAARRYRPGEIVDPVEANAIFGGRMSLTDSVRLAIATMISNGAGASVGMEAAYVQTASGILSFIGRNLKLRRTDMRVFVGAGAAAAIAAAFNAPLAGAFYAFELILGSYSPGALAQVAMAALSGTLVVRAILGEAPIYLLRAPPVHVYQWDYPLFAVLGLAAGLLGIGAMRAVTWCEASMRRLPTPDWLRPAIGGGVLGIMALVIPQVLGNGQGAIQYNYDTVLPLPLLSLLLAAKLFGSVISIGSGFRGGLFSSSLFLGSLFGAVLAQVAALFFPFVADQRAVFMLVGMGAVATAIVGAPVTMVLLVLEVTGEFDVALGVLAAVVVAATLVRNTFGYSFSTWRFHQRGVAIRGAYDVGWVSDITVGRLMHRDVATVRSDLSLARLRERVPLGSQARVFAVDADGHYKGMIDVATIHDAELDDAADGLVADDLAGGRGVFLLPGQDVRRALARFVESEEEMLPVVAAPDDRRVIGYLSEAFALRRYAEELERRRAAELGERGLFSVAPTIN